MAELAANILHLPKSRRLPSRRAALVLALVSAGLLAVLVVAGQLATPAAMETDFARKNLAPSLAHPFGTDWMGRDMLARTVAGLSLSILVGLGAACASSIIALVLGSVAALGGKRADAAVTWLIDLMMGVPHIVLLILISFALGKGFVGVTVGVALTHWPSLARIVRAEIMQCRQSGFVHAARKLGATPLQVALRHMVPFVLPAASSGAHPHVPPCHSARGGAYVPGLRAASRAAGHRRHPFGVHDLPVCGNVVAGGVPGPCAHRCGHAVRCRGVVGAPAGGSGKRPGVGGGCGSAQPGPSRRRVPSPPLPRRRQPPRGRPPSAAGGGAHRILPHVRRLRGGRRGRRVRQGAAWAAVVAASLPCGTPAGGAGGARPARVGPRRRDRGRGGCVRVGEDPARRCRHGAVRAERQGERHYLLRRPAPERAHAGGASRPRHLAGAPVGGEPGPAHARGAAGAGLLAARGCGRAQGSAA